MKIKVVEHREEWAAMFCREAALIRDLLGDELIAVFHIGSTSVPGLPAKPIIDILPVVADIERLDQYADGFAKSGYEAWGEYGLTGRRYYPKGGDNRICQAHAFQYDNVTEVERHLAFRDFLRVNEAVRTDYGQLKIRLARQYPNDLESYCRGKDEFVKRIEAEALKWRWRNRRDCE